MTQFMVIETFFPQCKERIYTRFEQQGRCLPDGLLYIDSWLAADGQRCFQLMQTENGADTQALFDQWISHWSDLASFDIIELGIKP